VNIPQELEKKLMETIKLNQPEPFGRTLDRIFLHIADLHFDYMYYMILHVFLLMKNALKELNDNRIHPIVIDLSETNGKILASETMEESKQIFLSIYDQ